MLIGDRERRRLLEAADLLEQAIQRVKSLAGETFAADDQGAIQLAEQTSEKSEALLDSVIELMADAFMRLRMVYSADKGMINAGGASRPPPAADPQKL